VPPFFIAGIRTSSTASAQRQHRSSASTAIEAAFAHKGISAVAAPVSIPDLPLGERPYRYEIAELPSGFPILS
jgi:hypothetical protein